ncbi:TPA: ATP-binding protein, partial [Campylobacter jejuni]|nr:ATP-binding protein [Campylobacter jejuni]
MLYKRKNIKFKNFVGLYKNLSLNKLFDFYSVFEGFKKLNILNFEDDVFT